MKMRRKSTMSALSAYSLSLLDRILNDRILNIAPRYNAMILFLIVCCGAAVIGAFVIRDMRAANNEAQEMYTGSVHGLQRIGELQYDAQETRRATLYALTTSDSNLQVKYADQSRDADQRVKDDIAEYSRQVKQPEEIALAHRLSDDWARYLGLRDDVLASILEGSTKEAVALDLTGGVPAFERVRQDLNEVKRLYDQDASRRQSNLVAFSRRSTRRLIEILSFTFLLSVTTGWTIQRSRMLSTIQLAKLQMEFVASVSHELRTPLAVISSAADNLADGLIEGKPALQRYGAILQQQSRSMGDLVNQILLFASTEDRKNRFTLRTLDIRPILDEIVASNEEMLKEARFQLEIQIHPDLPLVLGDRSGILQCLQNLIGNAVKYGGDHKQIALRAFAQPRGDGTTEELAISVADRGIGIDASELTQIFDPFYRSPNVRAAQIHGTGLGLSLAKRIAESMSGRLTVVSEISVGSTFTLHLQTAKGEQTLRVASDPRQAPSWTQ
jgi:signal transduction histidine kinase